MATVRHGVTKQKHNAFNCDDISLSYTNANHKALQFLFDDLAVQSECKQING